MVITLLISMMYVLRMAITRLYSLQLLAAVDSINICLFSQSVLRLYGKYLVRNSAAEGSLTGDGYVTWPLLELGRSRYLYLIVRVYLRKMVTIA